MREINLIAMALMTASINDGSNDQKYDRHAEEKVYDAHLSISNIKTIAKSVTGLMTTQVPSRWLTKLYLETLDTASQVFEMLFFYRNPFFVARNAS